MSNPVEQREQIIQGKAILFVHDNPLLHKLQRDNLADTGFTVKLIDMVRLAMYHGIDVMLDEQIAECRAELNQFNK